VTNNGNRGQRGSFAEESTSKISEACSSSAGEGEREKSDKKSGEKRPSGRGHVRGRDHSRKKEFQGVQNRKPAHGEEENNRTITTHLRKKKKEG